MLKRFMRAAAAVVLWSLPFVFLMLTPPGPVWANTTVTWAFRANMPTARVDTGVAAANGRIYVIGGYHFGLGGALAMTEEYDPATNTWASRAPMPTARSGLRLVAAANGKLYAIGGTGNTHNHYAAVEEYDPATNTWATKAPMPTARGLLGAARSSNGKIYAIGGYTVTSPCCVNTAAVEEYDPATNTWATKAPMPTVRTSLIVLAAANGRIYAIGGTTDLAVPMSTVEEYDPVTNTWATKAPMPTARWDLAGATGTNGRLYTMGGASAVPSCCQHYATVEEYDPAVNTWATLESMPLAMNGMEATTGANSKLYVFGGVTESGTVDSVLEATIATAPSPTPTLYRWDGFLQPIDDTAHEVGASTSIFKAGSTVPVKFQLKDAAGNVVQATSLPQWVAPVRGGPTTAPVDEAVYTAPATSGNTYNWGEQQYSYNWSTKGLDAGYYYRIGVRLDDGQSYYVNIGLR
jgi:N-acetylneuraminic acid mutarotase